MTTMPGPFIVQGGGGSVPPPQLVQLFPYQPNQTAGFSLPVTQQQLSQAPPPQIPHPTGHLVAQQTLPQANQAPIAPPYQGHPTGVNLHQAPAYQLTNQAPAAGGQLVNSIQQSQTSVVLPGPFNAQSSLAGPVLRNTQKWPTSLQDIPQPQPEETEEQKIERELYRKFGTVIKEHGPVEATNQKILNIFIQLTTQERKVIMAQGSIKAFLSKCPYINVSGNMLEITGSIPSESWPEQFVENTEIPTEVQNNAPPDAVAVGSGMPDVWLKEHLRQALFQRFAELLRDGPLEVTNQKVLNLFLKLTSSDRRFIMNYGGISEFLVTSGYIKLEDNFLVLRGEIPNETQITSDMAPGLFSGATNSTSPDSMPSFPSQSSLFQSSYLKASSPAFVPKYLETLQGTGANPTSTLGSLGVTGYEKEQHVTLNGPDQGQALPYSSSASPISSLRNASAQCSPLTVGRRGPADPRESSVTREVGTQSCVDMVDKSEQTSEGLLPSGAGNGISEKLAQRKLDQALNRAQLAEEKTIDLQAELCNQALARIRQDVLDNYIKIVKAPNRSEVEKAALQKDYSTVMRTLQDEKDRVEILHDSNHSALKDGLELKSLPEISFTCPVLPKSLATQPQTSFGVGHSMSSQSVTNQPDLSEKEDLSLQAPTLSRLRNRQTSETSSVLSMDSNMDPSKRPPGLDNLQELKVKGKESSVELTTERPQSHSSSEHSSLADSKQSHSIGLSDSAQTATNLPTSNAALPATGIPGIMPMFPGVMPPENMQRWMLMMQSMGHPPPNQLPSIPTPSDVTGISSDTLENGGKKTSRDSAPPQDKVKEYFPPAHDSGLDPISPLEPTPTLPESTKTITRHESKTMPSDLNSNLYHWPPSAVQDQKPVEKVAQQPVTPPKVDRWGTAVSTRAKTAAPAVPTDEDWNQDDFQPSSASQLSSFGALPTSKPHSLSEHFGISQPDRWRTSVEPQVTNGVHQEEAAAPPSAKSSRKPLPVIHSSISTVAPNVAHQGAYPKRFPTPAEAVRPDSTCSDTQATPVAPKPAAQKPAPQKSAPHTAKGGHEPQDAQKPNVHQKNADVDATNPLLSNKPSVMKPVEESIAGISEISMKDDIGAWETGWEHMLESDDQWQQVSKRKKTQEEEEAMSTNFEKLLQKIKESYPRLSRQDTIQVVNEVRQKRGGLKGISIAQILQDAADIIKEMKGQTKTDKAAAKDEGTGQANNPLYKTSICMYWQQGKCTKTTKECIFAHGKKDLRALPKTNMCNNILTKGSCPYGEKCIFAHSKEEMKKAH